VAQANLGKKQESISKIAKAKRAGGLAQAVKYQPSKYKALSSNSSIAKIKKKAD
jgi:hypothetical protein